MLFPQLQQLQILGGKKRVVNFLLTSSRLIVRCILSSQVRRGSWTTPIRVFYFCIPLIQGENLTGKADLRLSPSKCGSWIMDQRIKRLD